MTSDVKSTNALYVSRVKEYEYVLEKETMQRSDWFWKHGESREELHCVYLNLEYIEVS